jgi:hypothetical protein
MKTIYSKYMSSLVTGMLFSNSCILANDSQGNWSKFHGQARGWPWHRNKDSLDVHAPFGNRGTRFVTMHRPDLESIHEIGHHHGHMPRPGHGPWRPCNSMMKGKFEHGHFGHGYPPMHNPEHGPWHPCNGMIKGKFGHGHFGHGHPPMHNPGHGPHHSEHGPWHPCNGMIKGKFGHGHPPMHHPGHGPHHGPHFIEWTEAENKLLLEKYKECNGNWEAIVPFFKSRFAKQLEFHHKRLTEKN